MSKIWNPGDKISCRLLNELQEKAEAYDAMQKEADKSLADLTVDRLREIATENGIETKGLKKQELIDAIESAEAEESLCRLM